MRPTNGQTCLIVNRVAQYAPAIAVTVVSIGLIGYMIALALAAFSRRGGRSPPWPSNIWLYCGLVLRHPAELVLPAVDLGGRVWLGRKPCKGGPAAPAFGGWWP